MNINIWTQRLYVYVKVIKIVSLGKTGTKEFDGGGRGRSVLGTVAVHEVLNKIK